MTRLLKMRAFDGVCAKAIELILKKALVFWTTSLKKEFNKKLSTTSSFSQKTHKNRKKCVEFDSIADYYSVLHFDYITQVDNRLLVLNRRI